MAIRGAIFDCDGTIVDSMPMWANTCIALLENYGVTDAKRVFEEHESLDMDKKCYWYHDNLGIGESGEALYRELWEMVENAYRTAVKPFEGVRDFLNSLTEAGIPMVIASSTPVELLKLALATHDLDGYFQELVFAGDVGRGKEYPDVYLASCERLGTSPQETWVFEDAPFGMRSATRAGFPVVGLINDHDGRDEDFVRSWSAIMAHSYGELSLEMLRDWAPEPQRRVGSMRALIIDGSPTPSTSELVRQLANESDYVVAVDRGAWVARKAGVFPDVFCGDADSADADDAQWAHAHSSADIRVTPLKYATDLSFALDCVRNEARRRECELHTTITCATGGRVDHALAVFGVLAQHADLRPRIVEDDLECRILSATGDDTWILENKQGHTLSALGLAEETRVTEKGMRWNVSDHTLAFLDDRGISNVIEEPCAEVRCHTGVLAVFVLG